jgi:PleD family two-component response regulator
MVQETVYNFSLLFVAKRLWQMEADMGEQFKIIIIDDEQGIIDSIKENLPPEYLADGFITSKEGIDAIKENNYDRLILDYFIDTQNGKQVTKK